MHRAEARVATGRAAEHLEEFAHFWSYTYPVGHEGDTAEVRMPGRDLYMEADPDHLIVRLSSDDRFHFYRAMALLGSHVDRSALPETGIHMNRHRLATTRPITDHAGNNAEERLGMRKER